MNLLSNGRNHGKRVQVFRAGSQNPSNQQKPRPHCWNASHPMTPKPDSRLPWRVVYDEASAVWQVWTRYDGSSDSWDNYIIAGSIQSEEEAHLIAQAPQLQSRVQSLTTAKDAALVILEPKDGIQVALERAIREAIEVLKRS